MLDPADEENYYRLRDLIPADLWGPLHSAHVVIINYHAFLPRDRREIKGVAAKARQLLNQGKKVDPFKWKPVGPRFAAAGRRRARSCPSEGAASRPLGGDTPDGSDRESLVVRHQLRDPSAERSTRATSARRTQ